MAGAMTAATWIWCFEARNLPRSTLFPEQRTIAHILGTLDDKIELNRRMNETLEAMARALFKSWFVDFEPVRAKMEGRDTGLPQDIADLFPDRLVDSELGKIPEGWEAGALGDIAFSPRRSVKPASLDGETPYIGLEHMPRHSIALTEWENVGKVTSNKSIFEKGEVLFGKLRPYFHKVGTAPVDGVCSTDVVVIASKATEWSAFALACVSSVKFVSYTNQASTGTKMPRTSWKIMGDYRMCLPTAPVARAFQNVAHPVLEHIIANIHESRTLASLRDTLLPKLVIGEVRVEMNDANVNEPNQPITVENTDIVEIDGQSMDVPVNVMFRLLPFPTVVIEADELPNLVLKKERFEIALANGARFEAMVRSFNPGTLRGSLIPARQPVNVIDKGVPLRLLHFSILNFPEFYGNQTKWRIDEGGSTAIPHTKIEASDWCVEVTGVQNISDVVKTLKTRRRIRCHIQRRHCPLRQGRFHSRGS